MREINKFFLETAPERILNKLNKYGICLETLSVGDIVDIFELQAKKDISNDKPILENSSFVFFSNKIDFIFNYSISKTSDLENRTKLNLSGSISNGRDGFLSDEEKVFIKAEDGETCNRVYKSFGVENSLPVKVFFESMFEDALKPDVKAVKMRLVKNKLAIILRKNIKH